MWVHGTVEGASAEFARGVECGVDDPSGVVWEGFLVGYFEGCALGGKAYVVWMRYLH